jgi:hypothetical protein
MWKSRMVRADIPVAYTRNYQKSQNDNSPDREAVIAEFIALREEILHRSNLQWNVFALQLTATGVIFSFALSSSSHIGMLLILPVITYALTGRYVSQGLGTDKIGKYIREVLDVKMKGAFHWEEWKRTQPPIVRTLSWINPLYLIFPGVAVVALASVAPYVWVSSNTSAGNRVLLVIVWFVGIAITALSFMLITRRASKHWLRTFTSKVK